MTRRRAGRSVRPMFRSIVIGYDAPDRGDESIALAEVLRDPRKGTLLLTSAYSLAPLAIGGFAVPREIEELREGTHKMLAAARDVLPAKHRARILAVASESPARMLTEVAEAEHADLVVVGSSHRGAIGRVLPGTTAERLLHGAPCAVAVAPRAYRGEAIRRIGVAYDGSPEAEAAVHAAEALAVELRVAPTVYSVVAPTAPSAGMIAAGTGAEWPSRAAKERARHLLWAVPTTRRRASTLLLHGEPAAEIAARAQGVIDLLFTGSRGYGPLRHALLGSVSGALVRDAGCPVVLMPRTAIAQDDPAPTVPRAVHA